ncbi:MAG: c-type cytochrome [Deltaproteobacteria bacterium]|nr:c-type cytochrome [Deltaproteobacteria bacterium]
MKIGSWIGGLLIALVASAGAANPDAAALRARVGIVFGELPKEAVSPANPLTEAKIKLGRLLYYDERLSLADDISCNSCHLLDRFGVDGEPTSPGHEGQRGGRNSPTVYNAALHTTQFWDGREPDVEAQAKGPILNPVEMAMPSDAAVISKLQGIPGYGPLFAAAFPGESDALTYDNLAKAIGAFERRLLTPGPFDAFLAGDDAALDEAQLRGLATFFETGCTTCHLGPALGGAMFQKLGLVHPYETEDTGRMTVTGNEVDKYFFKVPSLRNISKTGPWFHDGSLTDLSEVVRLMAWHQLGRELDAAAIADIVAFLDSLTGEVDAAYIAEPAPVE